MCDPDELEELLAIGSALPPADRRALLYPLAARSVTFRLWLRWVGLFTPVFAVAMLFLLAGMLAALAGVNPTVAVIILQAGTTPLVVLAVKTWRIGWQVLLVAAALAVKREPT